MVAEMHRLVNERLKPRLESIIRQRDFTLPTAIRQDAWPEDLDEAFRNTKDEFYRRYTDEEARALARKYGISVAQFNQMQIERNFRRVVGVDVFASEPWLAPQIQMFASQNVSLIRSIPEKYFADLETGIFQKMSTGSRFEELGAWIEERTGIADRKASLIARDQVSKLNGQLTGLRQTNAGVTKYIWRTSQDERVRDSHREKEGKIFSWDDPPADTGHPGEDVNCVLPDTLISLPSEVTAGWKRFYAGEIVKITSVSGESISVTPNHPILTGRGWVRANEVQPSDQLFQCLNPQMLNVFNAEVYDNAPSADHLFDFLSVSGPSQRIRGSDVQFHGDGVLDQEVEVVRAPGVLADHREALALKKICDLILSYADLPKGSLLRESHLAEALHVNRSSPRGPVGIFNLSDALGGGHSRPFELLGLGLASDLYSFLKESSSYDVPGGLEHLREFILGVAALIEGHDLPDRQVFAVKGSPALYSAVGVGSISRFHYSGSVLNFSTTTSIYNANGICVHNCRCFSEPYFESVVEGEAEFKTGVTENED